MQFINRNLAKYNSALYCLEYFCLGMVFNGFGPLIVLKAIEMNLKQTDFSSCFSLKGLGGLLASFVTSKLEKYLSWQQLLGLAFGTIFIANYINIISQSLFIINLMFFAFGIATSVMIIITNASVLKLFDKQDAQLWTKSLHFSFGIGSFCSPVLISLLRYQAYVWFSIFGLAITSSFLWLKYPQTEGNHQIQTELVQTKKEVPPQLDKLFIILMFCYIGTDVPYSSWIATFGVMSKNISMQQAFLGPSITWICMTIGRGLSIPLSYVLSTPKQLRIQLAGILFSAILGIILLIFGQDLVYLYVVSALLGLSMSSVYPLITTTPGYYNYSVGTKNMSKYLIGHYLSEMTIPFIVGMGMHFTNQKFLALAVLFFAIIMCYLFTLITDYFQKLQQEVQIQLK